MLPVLGNGPSIPTSPSHEKSAHHLLPSQSLPPKYLQNPSRLFPLRIPRPRSHPLLPGLLHQPSTGVLASKSSSSVEVHHLGLHSSRENSFRVGHEGILPATGILGVGQGKRARSPITQDAYPLIPVSVLFSAVPDICKPLQFLHEETNILMPVGEVIFTYKT